MTTRPEFEPVTMPAVFDHLADMTPPGQTLDDYDRTTLRLMFAGLAALRDVLALADDKPELPDELK